MFDRILIANRGEIAVRIMRTCHRLGIEAVAVYSDADAGALHVREADIAVGIGGMTPAESYLRGDRLIEVAQRTGAQAIHPGYGFLSENPDFVEAVEAEGLTFIGPSSQAIRAMGLKDAAKRLMDEAGVPVVPGYHGVDQSDDRLAQEAGRIGYPVLLKAVAGGGGKGMRRVEAASGFAEALASARAEAGAAFGNTDMLVEKYVTSPRHIEVQVFGDGTRAVHLFERDCSLQRRHQKVIEEAPAPGMTAEMRAVMGAAAVRAAEAIGYRGAGTVEFIVDGSDGLHPDRFWFMEMNTRLQVEHPVTEAITGQDLVEWQLRVAAGEGLPARQEELDITGHAFEARLYAEDVPKGFLPATGRLDHLVFPPVVRADSGVETGDVISPHYDPMIAKVIVHGPDRASALTGLATGLARTEVAGLVTNIAFLQALARHDGFAAGQVDTGLIDRDLPALAAEATAEPRHLAQAALVAAGLWDTAPEHAGFALWAPLDQTVALGECRVVLRAAEDGWDAVLGDGAVVQARRRGSVWRFDGRAGVACHRAPGAVTLFDGVPLRFDVPDPLAAARDIGSGDLVEAPMPGRVTHVSIATGDRVQAGDRLLTLEAMKMEHQLRAPRDGVVARVSVSPGLQVQAGDIMVALEEVSS